MEALKQKNVEAEPFRTDELTNKRFTIVFDPDNLPIEWHEIRTFGVRLDEGDLFLYSNKSNHRANAIVK